MIYSGENETVEQRNRMGEAEEISTEQETQGGAAE